MTQKDFREVRQSMFNGEKGGKWPILINLQFIFSVAIGKMNHAGEKSPSSFLSFLKYDPVPA